MMANFRTHFTDADRQSHLKNQHGAKTAGNTEYGSTNNAFSINNLKVDIEISINNGILAGLSKITTVADEKINLMLEQKKPMAKEVVGAYELTTSPRKCRS